MWWHIRGRRIRDDSQVITAGIKGVKCFLQVARNPKEQGLYRQSNEVEMAMVGGEATSTTCEKRKQPPTERAAGKAEPIMRSRF